MFSKELHKAQCALEEFLRIHPQIPSQTIRCFIAVAGHPGITNHQVQRNLKLGQSSASRNISILTKTRYDGEPGLDLVDQVYEGDGRQLGLYLTPKGQRLANRVEEALQ